MASTVNIDNQTFKRRNPVAVWIGLPLITLGIYYFVWWYKINSEAKRFLNDDSIKPGISVLAMTLGAVIIVPPFVSIYRTTERVARMQQRAGMPGAGANPWISILLAFVVSLNRLYLQSELNRIWDGYLRGGTQRMAAPVAPALPPPAPGIPPPTPVLSPPVAPPAGPPTS
jgi:hypothetical protein